MRRLGLAKLLAASALASPVLEGIASPHRTCPVAVTPVVVAQSSHCPNWRLLHASRLGYRTDHDRGRSQCGRASLRTSALCPLHSMLLQPGLAPGCLCGSGCGGSDCPFRGSMSGGGSASVGAVASRGMTLALRRVLRRRASGQRLLVACTPGRPHPTLCQCRASSPFALRAPIASRPSFPPKRQFAPSTALETAAQAPRCSLQQDSSRFQIEPCFQCEDTILTTLRTTMCECLLFEKNCMITHNQLHNQNARVSLLSKCCIPQTALNIPEERIVTDRSIASRTKHCGHS